MIPRLPNELLALVQDEIFDIWGNTPLSDAVANRSDPLVRLIAASTLGQSELEKAFEAFIARDAIQALEEWQLEAAAARRGFYKKLNTKSKTTIFVTGTDGLIFKRGETLTDRFGTEWENIYDIQLKMHGSGCAFAQGVACCVDAGSNTLRDSELSYDNSSNPDVFAATNGIMLEIGGAQESDEVFRNRISGNSPLSRVYGSLDAGVEAIYLVDNVNFAKYVQVEGCDNTTSYMYVVHGGEDSQICEQIKLNANPKNLLGSTQCTTNCSEIRFQRPCPVLLKTRITLTNECPEVDEDFIKSQIMLKAGNIARQEKVNAKTLASLHEAIDKVEFCPDSQRPLSTCPEEAEFSITDPIDGSTVYWATDENGGVCSGIIECDNAEECDYTILVKLSPWQYPIIDVEFIEFKYTCETASIEACDECQK